jgi:serine/threonine protein kinase
MSFPIGATLHRGDYRIMEHLRGGPEAGQYMAIGPRGACLVTLSSRLTLPYRDALRQFELPVQGIEPLATIAALETDEGQLDAMVEAMPPGKASTESVSPGSAAETAASVARIAKRAHALGLAVGGIRPELVFVDKEDFGAVSLAPRGEGFLALGRPRREASSILFERLFLAPEQATKPQASAAADVFCLGAALTTWLGHYPFGDGQRAEQLGAIMAGDAQLKGVPQALAPLVTRMLTRDPEKRPTMAEVEASLRGG